MPGRPFPRRLLRLARLVPLLVGLGLAAAACGPPLPPPGTFLPSGAYPQRQGQIVVTVNGLHEGDGNFSAIKRELAATRAWVDLPGEPAVDGDFHLVNPHTDPGTGEWWCNEDAAAELAGYIEGLGLPPGERVDLIGYSEGGIVVQEYLAHHGGAARADDVVLLGSPNDGTLQGYNPASVEACNVTQTRPGSPFLQALAAADRSPAGVHVVNVYARGDDFITRSCGPACVAPYDPVIADPDVTNVGLDLLCTGVGCSRHMYISQEPGPITAIADALYDG